ncbi:hypothetical protein HZC30_01690 [Candidatus Woesearchaeota archaeon]|nr:hypothetical protein [Candidatus Woesearchaeota archaeon]
MTNPSELEQKLRMLVIDDGDDEYCSFFLRRDKEDFIVTDKSFAELAKYDGLYRRYGDIFTVDEALTFCDPMFSRKTWAKMMLKDRKYDLIVVKDVFVSQCLNGDEISRVIRGRDLHYGNVSPQNAKTYIICYPSFWQVVEDYRANPKKALDRWACDAIVIGEKCAARDLFIEIDKYLAEHHPEKLAYIRLYT